MIHTLALDCTSFFCVLPIYGTLVELTGNVAIRFLYFLVPCCHINLTSSQHMLTSLVESQYLERFVGKKIVLRSSRCGGWVVR